jgi:hypothetical protein
MAFTRFRDDPARIQKQLQESTDIGRYRLEMPGPGSAVPFVEDPHIRLQGWGANLRNNTLELNSNLLGLDRRLTHDVVDYHSKTPLSVAGVFPVLENAVVNESRASHPAWMFRDLEQNRWETPLHPVQNHVLVPFPYEVSTRFEERYIRRSRFEGNQG